jgi:hypothetical protein
MVKTEAKDEEYQHTDHLGSWIETMHPGTLVKVKENIHSKLIDARLTCQHKKVPRRGWVC